MNTFGNRDGGRHAVGQPADTLPPVARIKADVRREEILRATCREVVAHGFASTRVGDVADAHRVTSGLVF
jgi:AcrR family transcriptional regulator